jgi:hypothetical protein
MEELGKRNLQRRLGWHRQWHAAARRRNAFVGLKSSWTREPTLPLEDCGHPDAIDAAGGSSFPSRCRDKKREQ